MTVRIRASATTHISILITELIRSGKSCSVWQSALAAKQELAIGRSSWVMQFGEWTIFYAFSYSLDSPLTDYTKNTHPCAASTECFTCPVGGATACLTVDEAPPVCAQLLLVVLFKSSEERGRQRVDRSRHLAAAAGSDGGGGAQLPHPSASVCGCCDQREEFHPVVDAGGNERTSCDRGSAWTRRWRSTKLTLSTDGADARARFQRTPLCRVDDFTSAVWRNWRHAAQCGVLADRAPRWSTRRTRHRRVAGPLLKEETQSAPRVGGFSSFQWR